MSNFIQKLNLRPQELRLVVFVAAVVFVLLHFWLVHPHFKDWKQYQLEIVKAQKNLANYQAEIAKSPQANDKLKALESQGSTILAEEQATRLIATIYATASQKKVMVASVQPRPKTSSKTNEYFDEQIVSVSLNPTGDKELVDYLVALGADDSMIRVQEMSLKPDPTQTKLMGSLILVASYQKKPKTETAAVAVSTNKPALRKKP
jgi:Tfp pilus assembly protein PilO